MSAVDLLFLSGWALMLAAVGVGLWRIARGPTSLDRLLGFDTATIAGLGLLVLFSAHEGTPIHLELVLVLTALGFFTTVAYFFYLSRMPEGGSDFQPRRKGGRR